MFSTSFWCARLARSVPGASSLPAWDPGLTFVSSGFSTTFALRRALDVANATAPIFRTSRTL